MTKTQLDQQIEKIMLEPLDNMGEFKSKTDKLEALFLSFAEEVIGKDAPEVVFDKFEQRDVDDHEAIRDNELRQEQRACLDEMVKNLEGK